MSSAATSPVKKFDPPRRSTRVRAQLPIRVSSLESAPFFSENCHTVVINCEGCGVRLKRSLDVGFRVALDELPVGHSVDATVVSCVPIGSDGKYFLLGLALEAPGNIWCIRPTPPDWDTQPLPSAAVELPKKANEWPYAFFSEKGEAHPGRR